MIFRGVPVTSSYTISLETERESPLLLITSGKQTKKRGGFKTCMLIAVYRELSSARNCVNHDKPLLIAKWGLIYVK